MAAVSPEEKLAGPAGVEKADRQQDLQHSWLAALKNSPIDTSRLSTYPKRDQQDHWQNTAFSARVSVRGALRPPGMRSGTKYSQYSTIFLARQREAEENDGVLQDGQQNYGNRQTRPKGAGSGVFPIFQVGVVKPMSLARKTGFFPLRFLLFIVFAGPDESPRRPAPHRPAG